MPAVCRVALAWVPPSPFFFSPSFAFGPADLRFHPTQIVNYISKHLPQTEPLVSLLKEICYLSQMEEKRHTHTPAKKKIRV